MRFLRDLAVLACVLTLSVSSLSAQTSRSRSLEVVIAIVDSLASSESARAAIIRFPGEAALPIVVLPSGGDSPEVLAAALDLLRLRMRAQPRPPHVERTMVTGIVRRRANVLSRASSLDRVLSDIRSLEASRQSGYGFVKQATVSLDM